MSNALDLPQANSKDNFNVDVANQKPDPDFQRWSNDPTPLEQALYQAFGGHRRIKIPITRDVLGEKKTEYVEDWITDEVNRAINDYGCSCLAGSLYPFLSPNTTTSNLSEQGIYDFCRAKTKAIRYDLLLDYINGNGYELKLYKLSNITTTCLGSMWIVMHKALEGFTTKQLTETMISTFISRNNPMMPQQDGMLDRIQKSFGFKGK